MELDKDKKYAVKKKVVGDPAILYSEGIEYGLVPENLDFEPALARDISDKDFDFALLGRVVNKSFIVTDIIYHGEFFGNKPWSERYLELKNHFTFTPSIRLSGAIVVGDAEEMIDVLEAYSYTPLFGGVYIEGYESDIYEERICLDKNVVEDFLNG